MKVLLTALWIMLLSLPFAVQAQQIESIHVNLYTDSLKKGTYNYINVDGKLSNGKYLPLDSSHLLFKSSYGKFFGNSLFIDRDCSVEKITVSITMKKNPSMHEEFIMYIKKKEDNERLPTSEEILEKMKKKR